MSTVGIMTFSDSINYGAVLQSVGLSAALQSLGHVPEVIDYSRSAGFSARNGLKAKIRSTAAQVLSQLAGAPVRTQRTAEFRRTDLTMSPGAYMGDELRANPPNYDTFIAGSDQVWNLEHTRENTAYLLDFVPADRKRISYAASFGHDVVSPEHAELLRQHLSLFDAISVREKSGVEIVKQVTNLEAKLVLDPTLLLRKEDWLSRIKATRRQPQYVVEYVMPGHRETERRVRDLSVALARMLDCEVMVLGARPDDYPRRGVRHDFKAGPRQFLEYFANANGIITNSFHGTAFAVIFGKPFASVYRRPGSEATARSGRQISLLESLELSDRGITVEEVDDQADMLIRSRNLASPAASPHLADHRERSLEFLRDTVSN